jgi:hypothetical protein
MAGLIHSFLALFVFMGGGWFDFEGSGEVTRMGGIYFGYGVERKLAVRKHGKGGKNLFRLDEKSVDEAYACKTYGRLQL